MDLFREYLRHKSAAAFRRLAQSYSPLIYSTSLHVLHDRQLAEDAVQNVLLLLAAKAESLDAEHLSGWLVKTARFAARGLRGKRAAEVRLQKRLHPSLAVSDDGPADHAAAMAAIAQGLKQIAAESSKLIQRHYLERASTEELAAELGLSRPALRKRLSRAVADLRKAAKRAIKEAGN
jgi:RNA polymerase sigma-70 factor (ECF subfamily)